MKIGVTLPQFRAEPTPALAAARAAEDAGLDGVFVFDHLWPLRRPDRPALAAFPLLGALAVETQRVALGTLVARVGLVPNAVLAHAFVTLARVAGDRVIAGLGTGDSMSRAENEAYGVPFPPAPHRLGDLDDCCGRMQAAGLPVWLGGRSDAIRRLAAAHRVPVNVWAVGADEVAGAGAGGLEVTWGGEVTTDAGAVAERLDGLRGAGATWAVCAPPYGDDPAAAVAAVAAVGRAKAVLAGGPGGSFA